MILGEAYAKNKQIEANGSTLNLMPITIWKLSEARAGNEHLFADFFLLFILFLLSIFLIPFQDKKYIV